MENKSVTIFKNQLARERCLVTLLDAYLEKLPKAALDTDVFYCRSIQKYHDGYWYSPQARGKNYLSYMVKAMCREAGIEGDFSNHSLRASGATELFQSGVPERVIQDFTGHRSVKALRQYEQVAGVQKRAATNILTGTSHEFTAEVEKLKKQSGMSQQLIPFNNTVSAVPQHVIKLL